MITLELHGKTCYLLYYRSNYYFGKFVKCHQFILSIPNDIHGVYSLEIIQTEYNDPQFFAKYYEYDEKWKANVARIYYISDIFTKDVAAKLESILIELSDKEIRGELK